MLFSDLLGNLPEATPLRGSMSMMNLDTLPATETQLVESLKGSPPMATPGDENLSVGAHGASCPTSPASSVPSSAGKSDEAIWLELKNVFIFSMCC